MKQINFPNQFTRYSKVEETYVYKYENSIVGTLELLWITVYKSAYDGLDRSKAKTLKHLYKKIRDVTQYKDPSKDSRITKDGPQVILLEEAEFDLMKILISNNKLSVNAAEDLDLLWEVIESAKEYYPPKPQLVTAAE